MQNQSNSIRKNFIDKFVDKSQDTYRYSMRHGDFYGNIAHRSLLWESFSNYNIISRKTALNLLRNIPNVYITWDVSPLSLPRKLQKTFLLSMSGQELSSCLENRKGIIKSLPADIYIFDATLNFHITFTRVYIQGIGNICLTSLDNVPDPYISPAFRELFSETNIAQFGREVTRVHP